MFIFHEGLPRSGKSYEACAERIVPALKAGRKVWAYIEGLSHAKFAEVCELPIERVQELLHQVERDEVLRIHDLVENDSLVVIDELQNFFPSIRQPCSAEITRFVTEHGHRGIDIVGMGQDLRDVHALWKRRCESKIVFLKLSAVGMEHKYKWTSYRATAGEKFVQVTSGIREYNPLYFGLYKSHEDATKNKGNYQDKRTVIWSNKVLRIGVPAAVVVGVLAVAFLVKFFEPSKPKKPEVRAATPAARPAQARQEPPQAPKKEAEPPPMDYIEETARRGRWRLVGAVHGASHRAGVIELLDGSYHAQERMRISDLEALGWQVEVGSYGVRFWREKNGRRLEYIARPWPVEPFGRVSEGVRRDDKLRSEKN